MNTIRNITTVLALLLCTSTAHAAALAAARGTDSRNPGAIKRYLMKASTTIYAGGMVMIDTDGKAVPAAAAASNNGVVGVAVKTVTSAATGNYYILAQEGWFKFAGTTLAQGNVGELVYAEDDQTVDETASANEPVAGVLIQFVDASTGWVFIGPSLPGRVASTADPVTYTGDVTFSGGAGGITAGDGALTAVLTDNDTTALDIGSTGQTALMRFSTADATEKVSILGTTATDVFHVDVGEALFDEKVDVTGVLTAAAAAGALTFSDTAASIVIIDNDASALDIGSTGLTDGVRIATTNDVETWTFKAGVGNAAVSVAGATTLDASDCGKPIFVTAGIDTASITLPALSAVPGGCTLRFFYVGADAGALLDISPNAVDGIEGTCTLAASVVTFSGTDDADIGLTKATGIQGDTITLVSGDAADWYVQACAGIWANN